VSLRIDEVESPIGTVAIVVDERGALCALDFADCRERMRALLAARYGDEPLVPANDPGGHATRLRAYLAGDLGAFAGAQLAPGGTPFQREVWEALRRIPVGRTRSYGEIAASLGRPGAARAVGAANARNPVALAIPCHRVLGAGGALNGYAGGLERKRWLLRHEGART
jgi:O-6-methylguanine DNA methyltransferase